MRDVPIVTAFVVGRQPTVVAKKSGLQRYNSYRLESIQSAVNGKSMNIDYRMYFLPTIHHMIWMSCKEGILQCNPFLGTFSINFFNSGIIPNSLTEPMKIANHQTKM